MGRNTKNLFNDINPLINGEGLIKGSGIRSPKATRTRPKMIEIKEKTRKNIQIKSGKNSLIFDSQAIENCRWNNRTIKSKRKRLSSKNDTVIPTFRSDVTLNCAVIINGYRIPIDFFKKK
ncbi:hypothetical protein [Sphingobacterium sp.]|uniref:hypothetical protein n=1 Tax=Sphingobacterium sp. TaxID=341027 RepID=UPI00258FE76B|nr:hypothetical protein [Sphingobacterium sp.]WET70836.1 MAG: hypothetical protein P0Y57_07060 [Sphingobacterium sp.]